MEFPEELFGEILSHLRTDSASFRDLGVAFTCKALYREIAPLIKERQTALLSDALDKRVLVLWGKIGRQKEGRDTFRKSLQQDVERDEFFHACKNVELTVRSSSDADLLWSLHTHLLKYQGKGNHVFNRLYLKLESQRGEVAATSHSAFGTTTTPALLEEAWTDPALEATLVHWGTTKDQEGLARSLRAFLLLAMELTEEGMEIKNELLAQLQEPPMSLSQLETLDKAAAGPNVKLSTLTLSFMPCPQIFPMQNVDAILRASSTSLQELHLSGCLSRTPSDMWNAILSRWTFTRLSHLSITHTTIPTSSLVSFLQRNRTITTATFNTALQSPGLSPGPALKPKLQYTFIRSLTSSPKDLLPLFQESSLAFPSLESLHIIQNNSGSYLLFPPESLDDLTAVFSCIPASAPALHTLNLNLAYPGMLHAWLGSIASPPPPSTTPVAGLESGGGSVGANQKNAKPSLVEALGRLHMVSSLTFTVTEEMRSGDFTYPFSRPWPPLIYIAPKLIVDFVAAFPALRTASLVGLFYRPGAPSDEGRARYDEFWPEMAKIWTRAGNALMRLEISGIGSNVSHKTAVWVRGDKEPVGGFAEFPVEINEP